jgi:hypothetical protein
MFSLEVEIGSEGVTFTNAKELERELDWSPPSLYLFTRGQEPWNATVGSSDAMELTTKRLSVHQLFGPNVDASTCLYMSFRQEATGERSRTVLLAN